MPSINPQLEKCISILNQQEGEHSWSGEGGQENPNVFVCGRCGYRLYSGKVLEELVKIKRRYQNSRRINPLKEIEAPLQARVERLESELQTERESTQQALQTSQEWHERQKAELIAQWKAKLQTFIDKRKTRLQQEIQLIKEVLHE